MTRITRFLLLALMAVFVFSCGPDYEAQYAKEKAERDSIFKLDSVKVIPFKDKVYGHAQMMLNEPWGDTVFADLRNSLAAGNYQMIKLGVELFVDRDSNGVVDSVYNELQLGAKLRLKRFQSLVENDTAEDEGYDRKINRTMARLHCSDKTRLLFDENPWNNNTYLFEDLTDLIKTPNNILLVFVHEWFFIMPEVIDDENFYSGEIFTYASVVNYATGDLLFTVNITAENSETISYYTTNTYSSSLDPVKVEQDLWDNWDQQLQLAVTSKLAETQEGARGEFYFD